MEEEEEVKKTAELETDTGTIETVSDEDQESIPEAAKTNSELLRRGSKLRRTLLAQIEPLAYPDVLNSQSYAPPTFLGIILSLKIDRFTNLIERFISHNKKTSR